MTAKRLVSAIGPALRGWRGVALLVLLALAGVGASQAYAWYQLEAANRALAHYQNDAAREHLDRCLRLWPNSAAAHLLAARAERRAGRLAEAAQHLEQCQQSSPAGSDEVAFEWALLRAAMGDLPPVEEALQARIVSRPAEAPVIWEALSAGYFRSCRMPDALVCLDTWLHFEPDNAYAYFLRGELHRNLGAVSRARDEYQHAVELDPQHDRARRLLARCLVKLGRYQEAVEHLEILRAKTAGDPELETLLARSEYDLGEHAAALQRLDTVIRTHPGYGPALRERGRLALSAGEFAEAESALRRALTVLPHDYDAQWALQQALQHQGRVAEAAAQRTAAQQLKDRFERISDIQMRDMSARPFDPALHAELGELLLAIGQRELGERWLLSALRLNPRLPPAHAALAAFYREQGDASRADEHHRAAQQTVPNARQESEKK